MYIKRNVKTLDDWLNEYSVSHQNLTNKAIHWFCVPAIFFTVVAFLVNLSWVLFVAIFILSQWFYVNLSVRLAGIMALISGSFALIAYFIGPLWLWYFALFAIAWLGQFIGHHIEGKRPSFFEDVQFLLIGPAWVVKTLMRRVHL